MNDKKTTSAESSAKTKCCAYCGHGFGNNEFFNYSITFLNNLVKCSKCRTHNSLILPKNVFGRGCGCFLVILVILILVMAIFDAGGLFLFLLLSLMPFFDDELMYFPYIILLLVVLFIVYGIGDFFQSFGRWRAGSIVAVEETDDTHETMFARIRKFLSPP